MRVKLGSWGLVLLAALALGVGGAGGRSLATTTTVRVQVLGVGTVGDNRGQMQCGNNFTTCRVTYTGTTDVTFNEAPAAGWTFTGWGGDCSSSGTATTCTFTPDLADQDHEVIANFDQTPAPATSTLIVTASGSADSSGGGTVSGGDINCATSSTANCDWQVPTGSTVTLVETPDDGFVFDGWGGACSGTLRSCTLAITADRSVTATFRKPKVTVVVTGNGNVTGGGISCTSAGGAGCSAEETAGQDVTLTATPDADGSFTQWGGACSGVIATCTITISDDTSVTATFSGSGTAPPGTAPPGTFPLSVSVSGQGTVAGGGLTCGVGGSVCSENETAGSIVTLTATPASGETFTSWGGACSGTNNTCSVTMSSAKSVTATFSGGATAEVVLSVSVSGRGTVTGGGIKCGNGAKTCSAKEKLDSTVGLTATAAAGAAFAGWGGACSGVIATCTVEMSAATSVAATFRSAPGAHATGAAVLRSRGRPIVTRTRTGFAVTLRFRTNRRGVVHVRALRAGRLEAALSFTAPSGPAAIGPLPLAKPGFYAFDLKQAGRTLHWGACLGRCGEAAAKAAGPFALTRQASTVVDAGALWSVTLHFRSTQPAGLDLRVYRGKRLTRELRVAARAGAQDAGALLLTPGSYTLRLTATDGYGRVRTLNWLALLP
jgi:uncharacterized repeat protein (TIGR02543 family)